MPLADPSGPGWVREMRRKAESGGNWFTRLFGWLRPRRAAAGDDRENPGTAGAGRTAPLLPPTPMLSGGNARKLGDEL